MKYMELSPNDFQLEQTSVWSFPKRGAWANHSPGYPGNWAPQVVRNLLERYSNPGDLVVDPMAGGGTTLIECALLGRRAHGVDVSARAVNITNQALQRLPRNSVSISRGDARKMPAIADASVQLVTLHPPYLNIIRYGDEPENLSRMSEQQYFDAIKSIVLESWRILRQDGYLCVLIGDVRRFGEYIPVAMRVLDITIASGLVLKETVIKVQHNCRGTARWLAAPRTFLLMSHEYLFVLKKV